MTNEATTTQTPRSVVISRARRALLAASALFIAALAALYALRPDWAAAVTFWPAWMWAAAGVGLTLFGGGRRRWRFVVALTVAWAVFIIIFAQDVRVLLHLRRCPTEELETARREGTILRILTVNCCGGNAQAATFLKLLFPDVLLLQEVPAKGDVAAIAECFFGAEGDFAWDRDVAIVVRGKVLSAQTSRDFNAIVAHVALADGREFGVASVRLRPPEVRLDLWNPSCWGAMYTHRRAHREEMRRLLAMLDALPDSLPLIVGGDFNEPGGDPAAAMLAPRLRDSFPAAGRGWGDTVLENIPVARFDQIWLDTRLHPLLTIAMPCPYSDHRAVLCNAALSLPFP